MKTTNMKNNGGFGTIVSKFAMMMMVTMATSSLVLGQDHQAELDEARNRWTTTMNTDKYYFEYLATIQNDGDGDIIGVSQIESRFGIHVVRNRIIDIFGISSPSAPGGESESIELPDTLATTALTIEQMFDLIQEAIYDRLNRNPTINVEYDPFRGYPSQVVVVYADANDPPVSVSSPPAILSSNTTTTTTNSTSYIVSPNRLVGSIDKFVQTSHRMNQVVESKERWESYDYINYDMIYQRMSDEPAPLSSLVKIQVRDGAVSKVLLVTATSSTVPPPLNGPPPLNDEIIVYEEGEDVTFEYENAPTMIDLFDEVIATLRDSNPIDIDIDYTFPSRYLRNVEIVHGYSSSANGNHETNEEPLNFVISEMTLFHQDRLNDAMALWQTNFVNGTDENDYSFGYQRSCLCLPSEKEPYWVSVEDGSVTSVTPRSFSSVPIGPGPPPGVSPTMNTPPSNIPTMANIFARIQQAIDTDGSRIAVAYDETYGYPTKVFIDPRREVGDDEYDIVVDGFAPVTVWKNELEMAQSTWESQCYSSYSYILEEQCMTAACISLYDPKLIDVVDGQIVSVNGQPVDSDEVDDIPTIEEIFAKLNKALYGDNDNNDEEGNEKAFTVHVTYDEEFGWPSNVFINYDEMVPDAKYTIVLTEVIGGNIDENCIDNGEQSPPSNGDEDEDDEDETTPSSSADDGEDGESPFPGIGDSDDESSGRSSFISSSSVFIMMGITTGSFMLLL